MRDLASREKITEFMRAFGLAAQSEVEVYFTGGVTAVLSGWRDATVDIDLKFTPEPDELFRAIPGIKEKLQVNIELAAPSDFIPELRGWRDRCQYIGREGKVSFFHYDPYSQALAKIERGHDQDLLDVDSMIRDGSVDRRKLVKMFEEIEAELYKYPALDPKSFAAAVKKVGDPD